MPTTTTITVGTTGTTDAIDRFFAAVCGDHDRAAAASLWAEDAVLDAVVPGWRFHIAGPEKIEAQLRKWFRDPGELEEVRRRPFAGGEVVELTVTWTEGGVPHAARQVHVLELDDAGRITRDDMWCGGRWPAVLLAQIEAANDAG